MASENGLPGGPTLCCIPVSWPTGLGELARLTAELLTQRHREVGLVVAELRVSARTKKRGSAEDTFDGVRKNLGRGRHRRSRGGGAKDGEHLFSSLGIFEFRASFLVAEKTGKRRERLEMTLELSVRGQQ